MKAAVYNRYWSTGGGAEKYGATIAELLSRDFEVDLLGHESIDPEWLGERLQVDLSRVHPVELDDRAGMVTEASEKYDLFTNVSFMSSDRAASKRSLYVVHFPTATNAYLPAHQRFVVDRLGSIRGSVMAGLEWGTGFYHRERGRRGPIWTNGEATLRFTTPPGQPVPIGMVFGHQRPPELPPAQVRVEVNGESVADLVLRRPRSRVHALRGVPLQIQVRSEVDAEPVEVRIVSDTFVPAEVSGGSDRRTLGVPLLGLHVGVGLVKRLARWFPVLLTPPSSSDWIKTYGAVAANSQFTRQWIERYWQVDSELLYPPVTLQRVGDRKPVILNVGRFFPAHHGHSKKQLELVKAFRKLCDQGAAGWSLHLVGGCAADGERYVAQVHELARGYPIVVHVNVSGEELQRLYGAASIYWHASGLGERVERHPDRLEHFGITTVEAMSAGAVPVVIGLAGQLESVRHGVDGFHFRTLDGLVGLTRMLIDDDQLRQAMSRSAVTRARLFAVDMFDRRLAGIVDRLLSESPQLADREPSRVP